MRTKTLLIAAVLGVAGLASASAQVTSVNAVGYVNKAVVAGLNLIANPLSNGGNSIAEVLPAVTDGSQIYKWNGAGYDNVEYIDGLGWLGDATLGVGEGFLFDSPEDATITFVGEVLQGDATNKNVPGGLSMQGSTVPVAGTLTDHGWPVADGDAYYIWNAGTQGWDSPEFIEGIGWIGDEPTLGVGDAIFVDKAEGVDWDRNFTIN